MSSINASIIVYAAVYPVLVYDFRNMLMLDNCNFTLTYTFFSKFYSFFYMKNPYPKKTMRFNTYSSTIEKIKEIQMLSNFQKHFVIERVDTSPS